MRRDEPALLLSLAVLLGTSPALAVLPPATLYIKAKNTHVMASSDPAAKTLVVLQPGQEVTYNGRESGTTWCKVTVAAEVAKKGAAPVQGVIFQANLSTSPPSGEVTSKNPLAPLSSEAFASSGAAIKAVGPGTLEYGKTLSKTQSAEELKTLLDLANRIKDKDVVDYARAGGLPEVVGLPDSPVKSSGRPAAGGGGAGGKGKK